MNNNSDNDSFGSFFVKKKEHKSYLLQQNCLMIA